MLSRIRKWWADRKLAKQARKAPRWESGGYVGNPDPNRFRATHDTGNFAPLPPSHPFVVAPFPSSECPPPYERSHDDGRCQVIPIANDSGYSSHSESGSSSCDSGSSSCDSGSSSCDSGSSSCDSGSSDSGCSGGGGD